MKIVILDGFTANPGDLSWDAIAAQGELTVYDRTAPEETVRRIGDAEAVFTNKVLITRVDAEKEAAKIQERQAALQARSEKASAELAEKEQVMTNQIFNAIYEFVTALNAEGEYDIILASQTGAPVVSVKPELDLTQKIIEGLNAAYTPEKTK